MQFEMLHPIDQILMIMERIYGYGMTTTSGGNLSILDDNGDIWITPAGIDKGSLTRSDIVCVKPDGTIAGNHKPSSEYPFHKLIYRTRPDIKAVVHAHPPALVAFSIIRKIPNLHLLPTDHFICGRVGMAEYAVPGSVQLGENIAKVFEQGIDTVMLENHGIVVGKNNLLSAFQAFETLDYCARLEIKAKRMGTLITLPEEHLNNKRDVLINEFVPEGYCAKEREIRREMCKLIKRSYDQRLFTSTQGTFSERIDKQSFVITPFGLDRKYLEPEDLVRIEDGSKEMGKNPSRSALLHLYIYEMHPHIDSIIIAHPPNIMAFAVTANVFDSRIIPESYILLRSMPKLPYGATFLTQKATAAIFTKDVPIAIADNDCVIATGSSLLNAFDRLEVAEYSAKAIISAKCLGDIVPIDTAKIKEIDIAFKL
jgi:L-fuculose-phosphate aldolase